MGGLRAISGGKRYFVECRREKLGDAQRAVRARGLDAADDFKMEFRDHWRTDDGSDATDFFDELLHGGGTVSTP